MNIIVLNHHKQNITGGHKFNQKLYDYLSEISEIEVRYFPQLSKIYAGWKRLFAPFLELGKIKYIQKDDLVFFGDTTFKYHILLLLLCKLYVHSKNIIIIHHFTYLGLSGVKRRVFEFIQNQYYKTADIIIVPSPFTRDIAKKKLNDTRIDYVPLPFDNCYHASVNYNKGELLYVGTIEPRKGIHLLLESLSVIKKSGKHFEMNIVGKVVNKQYYYTLLEYMKKNNLVSNIHFMGRVSLEELNKLYSTAELFVFPSLLEGYGIVLVEALSYGLPIIAFNNSAMPYTVKSGVNGYLAENLDTNDFANQIMKVLCNKEERERLQKGAEKTMTAIMTEMDFKKSVEEFYNSIKSCD